MTFSGCCHPLLKCLVVGGLLLTAAACTLTEKRMDYPATGMNVPDAAAENPPSAAIAQPAENAPRTAPPGPLKVTITEAILFCLENNQALMVERLNPRIRQTFEDQERAVFDPTVSADVSAGKVKGKRQTGSGSALQAFTTDTVAGTLSLAHYFPTGTRVVLDATAQMNDTSYYAEAFYESRLGMTVSQALLKGFGPEANLARLQQARLDTRLSEYELRGFTEFLVAEVERTYWDYALARRQIEIVRESLKVARQQLSETGELISVGRLAKAELAAVQAEVAAQEQALIEAKAGKEVIRLQLLRLLNPSGPGIWQREIDLVHQPTLPDIELEDVALHTAVAARMRPLLNQVRLEILSGDLELVKTRNGLLPMLDLFVTLGKSGYANSFGQSIANINKDSYDALAGVRFNYPVFNREAKALHRRALLSRKQAQKALENLLQLVELDVRTAYIEVNRTKQQITASSATRIFDEEKLRTETEKLRVGKSTSFSVAQAQRDLLVSRIAEVRALVNYLKALTNLYRQDGSLLERRRISAPGREPVKLSSK